MRQVALITGASSGIGKATALRLAKKGYIVYAATRTPQKLQTQSDKLHVIELDITNADNIKNAIAHIINEQGKIDILINNAGYALVSSIEDATEDEMFNQFNINVFAILRLCKTVIPYMREQNSGIIINISSFLGKIGLPLFSFYNASKYAVEGITDSLRYELSNFNIRVHSIMPGFFNTDFAKSNLVINENTLNDESAYAALSKNLLPNIVKQINEGNQVDEAAKSIITMIEDIHSPARITIGDKAQKFIPMRRELSDEDFERRVQEYYNLNG
ncbi:SDR family oxidoreductase [Pseudoalteromonas denitrificans]|uniref:Short-chain dehydrogenase n=1 Tax=Pseudoalteromonas denitrificans DSM 6059 TaxID=1123010 RepID=A0A1I1U738_9GAMM|nr:SDR family oxidoreductase [Pseudoalteromonas denitrificans]SFD66691.1 Short-chain dehydrogenase [Pseudoalteromonas denitrificans DSM 6059]